MNAPSHRRGLREKLLDSLDRKEWEELFMHGGCGIWAMLLHEKLDLPLTYFGFPDVDHFALLDKLDRPAIASGWSQSSPKLAGNRSPDRFSLDEHRSHMMGPFRVGALRSLARRKSI